MDDIAEMNRTLQRNRDNARAELQAAIDKIVAKEMFELTQYEKDFLKARLVYLKPEEKAKFKSLFEEKKKSVK